jgi:hypothetical protein
MDSQQHEVRRRPDGSIDFDFYREQAKTLRTAAMGEAGRATGRAVAKVARAAVTWTHGMLLRLPKRGTFPAAARHDRLTA